MLIQVIPFIGLLTVDPKDRLKMSDLKNSKWIQKYVVEQQPSLWHMTPDILPHSPEVGVKQTFSAVQHGHQEVCRVQISTDFFLLFLFLSVKLFYDNVHFHV
jgi:hypothetical protein